MLDDIKEASEACMAGYEIRREAYEARAQKNRQFWAGLEENMTKSDKIKVIFFGFILWLVSLGIVLWENICGPGLF